jgi:hypothetical protein
VNTSTAATVARILGKVMEPAAEYIVRRLYAGDDEAKITADVRAMYVASDLAVDEFEREIGLK